jgi:hypothetical protein
MAGISGGVPFEISCKLMHKLPIARVASLNPDFCSDFLLVLL